VSIGKIVNWFIESLRAKLNHFQVNSFRKALLNSYLQSEASESHYNCPITEINRQSQASDLSFLSPFASFYPFLSIRRRPILVPTFTRVSIEFWLFSNKSSSNWTTPRWKLINQPRDQSRKKAKLRKKKVIKTSKHTVTESLIRQMQSSHALLL
jgi:hypothetical protein